MKAPIKAKAAARMLHEVIYSLTPVIYSEWKVDDIIRLQVRARAIVYYRLCPICPIVNVTESDTPEAIKEILDENRLWTGDGYFPEVFNVLASFQTITTDDLDNEFLELCPNIESFEQYLEKIIKPIYLLSSNAKNYKVWGEHCIEKLDKRCADGEILSNDTKRISGNIYTILSLIEQVWKRICTVYNEHLPSKEMTPYTPAVFSQIKSVDEVKRIRLCLIEKGYISGQTDENMFLYFFGCNDKVDNLQPILWIKKNRKTKEPNKKCLLDFLVLMGYKEKQIKQSINIVFSIEEGKKFVPQDYTKYKDWTKDINSEYHNELEEIVSKIVDDMNL